MPRKKKGKPKKSIFADIRYDVYAILLCAIGGIMAVAVLSQSAGILGEYGDLGLQYVLGKGRFLLPWVFIAWGIGLARGADFKLTTPVGVFICFISVVSIFGLSSPQKQYLNIDFAKNYGGLTGGLVSLFSTQLIGLTGSYILFVAALFIGVLLTINKSLVDIATGIKEAFIKDSLDPGPADKPRSAEKNKKVKIGHHSTVASQTNEIVHDDDITVHLSSDETISIPKVAGEAKEGYSLPSLDILKQSAPSTKADKKDLAHQVDAIEKTLQDFTVDAKVTNVLQGPTVTLHEIHLGSGVKVNKISNLEPDLALALATPDIRILSPIPGKSAVGIEVPNNRRELVTLGDILKSPIASKHVDNPLAIGLGKDISGLPRFSDIAKMPHLLIAGATGSGKSVAVNGIILSILMKAPPDQVKFLMIDPKLVELSIYNGIPHLLTPVVSNPKKASAALAWAVSEMEERYQRLFEVGAKTITAYNTFIKAHPDRGEYMPFILVIIDELADLMMASAADVEAAICRIAQMARAVGIHLVLATQRPSVNVITGVIKANITSRIAFAVSTQHDSRVIVDSVGAEKLVGRGDMLFMSPSTIKPERLQGAYVSEPEIEAIVSFVKSQADPEYMPEILSTTIQTGGDSIEISDPLWEDAVEIVFATGQASVSMLQRRLGIGYTRAGRLMDILEEKRIVGPYEGSKPRTLLMTRQAWEEMTKSPGVTT